ncbi:GDSL-type esterase/lipase family protein [Aquimarina sp. 2-A2]|uniref:GDSL-type esterase/lipase family protein n=1 Tax=Aquimarina sp. 2-A2 TaxID=3382644 RepID=UPI00387F363D
MKRILLILFCLVGLSLNAQVVKWGNATYTIGSVSGVSGSSNENVFIPSSPSDFTTGTSARANSIWAIQKDFDLTASNFTVPTGVMLVFDGGKIITTGSVVFDKTQIHANDKYAQIFNVGDLSGTVKGDVVVNWFGLVGDGVTDNRATFLKAAKLVNASGGTAYLYNDTDNVYAFSAAQHNSTNRTTPANIVITGDGTSWQGVPNEHGNPKIKMLGHNFSGSEIFAFWKTDGASIRGIDLIGERDEHTLSGVGNPDERNHLIVVGSDAMNVTIENCSITKAEADGIWFANDNNFSNPHNTLAYTQGNINESDGAILVDDQYMYSNSLFSLTTAEMVEQGKFMLVGDAFGTTFKPKIFFAAYYDGVGTYVGKSERLYWYESVRIPDGASQVRIIIPYTTVSHVIRVTTPYISEGTVIRNNIIAFNKRDGISNPGQFSIIEYNQIYNTGTKSPGLGINLEDGYHVIRNNTIRYNTFRDNYNGDISVKGAEHNTIAFNEHAQNDTYNFITDENGVGGVNAERGRYTKLIGSRFYNRSVTLGRGVIAQNLTMIDGQVQIYGKESAIDGGEFHNVWFKNNNAPEQLEGRSHIRNATLYYDEPLRNPVFSFRGDAVIENVLIDFKNSFLFEVDPANGKPTFNLETSLNGLTYERGYIDNLNIINFEVADSFKFSQGFNWYWSDIRNLHSSIPLQLLYGKQEDAHLGNITVPRFRIRPRDFSATGSNIVNLTIDNLNIHTDHVDYTSFTAYPLETEKHDFNLIVNGGEINVITGISRIINLQNTGTKVFNNLKFNAADPITLDLHLLASGGGITFNNCPFSSNITVKLRAQDRIIKADGSVIKGSDTYVADYNTVADLPDTHDSPINYAMVVNDTASNNLGLHAIVDGAWKLIYHNSDPKIPVYRSEINEINLDSPDIEDGLAFVNGGDGTSVNAATYLSNYIPVKKGDRLGRINFQTYRFYDENKVAIPRADAAYGGSNNNDDINITDDKVAFVRWTGNIADKGITDMVVKEYNKASGAEPSGWANYGTWVKSKFYTFKENGEIFPSTTNSIFDYRYGDYTTGYTSTGTVASNVGSTGFLKVDPNTAYSHNYTGNLNVSFWNESNTFISGLVGKKFVSPATAAYVNVQLPRTIPDVKDVQVVQGSNANNASYNAYKIDSNLGNGIEVCLIGDSIGTEDDSYATASSYASVASNALGVSTLHNLSVSGKSMNNFATNINTGAQNLPSTSDLYIIALGTNDFGYNRPIGTLNVGSDPGNFYGSINDIVTDIETANPSAKIVFLTPIKRSNGETANATGNILKDYADAIVKYAITNGHGYLDLFNKSGIDPYRSHFNTAYFVSADGLHPNNEGHRIFMYPLVVKFLQTQINKL